MEFEPHGPVPHDQEDDSPEAIAERMRALYGIEKTSLDELIELSRTAPDSEKFDVLLDDLALEALRDNEEFVANAAVMRSGTASPDEQVAIRTKQRGFLATYREAILIEAGLPTEAATSELEKSRQKVQAIIHETIDGAETPEIPRVLEVLGIISHNKDGKEIFTYPRELFPSSTNKKWDTYIEGVRKHVRLQDALDDGLAAQSEVEEADLIRRMAHNTLARDVDEILGLGKLPKSKWDFEDTRNLLAKMRDSRFPTIKTGEMARTQDAVIEGVIGLHALRALRMRHSDMYHEDEN